MPDEVELTEFTVLDPDELHLVKRGANGFLPLLAKSIREEIEAAKKSDHDAHADDQDSDEADEVEDELTKAVSDGFCGFEECAVCGEQFGLAHEALKAKLKAKQRHALSDSSFAIPEKRAYPIHDESHARNALARVSQFGNPSEKKRVRAAVRRKYPGIKVSKSPGVPDFATQMPREVGHVADTGQSGQRLAPMQTGCRREKGVSAQGGETPAVGGSSTAVIPLEQRVINPPEATLTAAKVAFAVSSLAEAMEKIHAQRGAQKGDWLSLANPDGAAASEPSSGPWEDYDSVSLAQVAEQLAACGHAIAAIQQREAIEAVSGNPGDVKDTFDLGEAERCLDCALGIVARLSFHEGAASKEALEKVGRRLSGMTESALRAARDHLSHVLGEGQNQAGLSGAKSEEDEIMTTLTKEELDQQIGDSSARAVKEALKAERKRLRKEAKKAAKREAKKNANNGGDIARQQLESGVNGHADANDVNAIPDGGKVAPQYVNTKKGKKAGLAKEIRELRESFQKAMSRPRAGGPHVTGVIPGGFAPAEEGRLGDGMAKSAEPEDRITVLKKQLEEAQGATGPSAMQRAADISYQLTREQLKEGHRTGELAPRMPLVR